MPANFWGVVPQAFPTLEQFQRLKRGGVDSVRFPIVWSAVQPEENGAFNWSDVDRQVESVSLAGLNFLPFVSGAPNWAVPTQPVPGSHGSVTTPRNLPVKGAAAAGWKAFVEQAVRRYGPTGSFWAEHPAVPNHAPSTWQIWNEENYKYFVIHPNPVEYGKLVKISYAAVKNVDRRAQVILGGLFARPREAEFKVKPPQAYFATDFLKQMYKATPGIKSKFNGIALHPYTTEYRYLTPEIEEVRAVLKSSHDAGKNLWITELGWSSGSPKASNGFNQFEKGKQGQVKQLKGAFELLLSHRRQWRLQGLYWFASTDQAHSCNFCDGAGLFTEAFAPKPSWTAYTGFAGGRP